MGSSWTVSVLAAVYARQMVQNGTINTKPVALTSSVLHILTHLTRREFLCSHVLLSVRLSGYQADARPNSASEAFREGAIDPGRQQGGPGVGARGGRVGREGSGSGVGLPIHRDLCQEQDHGGRAVC